jgi:hypothetical protein
MSEEAKCECQRCGQPIAFPIDLHNTEVECPHCHKATSLLIPSPESRIHAIPEPASVAPALPDLDSLIIAGFLTAIFLPLIGFIIGIILLAKNQVGSGIGCTIMSLASGAFWLAVISHFR